MTKSKQAETGQMKAIVRERFGSPDVLQLKEIEKPAPNDSRGVLVKVYASSVNPADRYDVNGMSLALRLVLPLFRMGVGVRRPKEPQVGTDLAGTVEAVSSNVTQFKPGDEVYGVGFHGYAEYAVARENRVALKPKNRSFEESAAVPIAGFTALQALRNHGHIEPGKKVLINGRNVRGPDCQIIRGRSHCGDKHAESRHGTFPWRRPRHRLYQRRLH